MTGRRGFGPIKMWNCTRTPFRRMLANCPAASDSATNLLAFPQKWCAFVKNAVEEVAINSALPFLMYPWCLHCNIILYRPLVSNFSWLNEALQPRCSPFRFPFLFSLFPQNGKADMHKDSEQKREVWCTIVTICNKEQDMPCARQSLNTMRLEWLIRGGLIFITRFESESYFLTKWFETQLRTKIQFSIHFMR